MTAPISPGDSLSTEDAGGEVQRRFRYQAAFAAMTCISLLDEESELDSVFCEQYEDLLVRRRDGTFEGIQVKSREVERGPWKAYDPEIPSALARFANLEREFGRKFLKFVLATNVGFWGERKNRSNLGFLLSAIREQLEDDRLPVARSYVAYLVEKSQCDRGTVASALSKVQLEGSLPGLNDIETHAVRRLSESGQAASRGYNELKSAVDALIDLSLKAAAVTHRSTMGDCVSLMENPEREVTDRTIERKKITKDMVLQTLRESMTPEGLLRTWKSVPLSQLPRGMRTTELKMSAGGVSVGDIGLAKDHKYSTEVLLDELLYREGPVIANKAYEHLRTLIRTECQEVYDDSQMNAGLFGTRMLSELRRRLREVHSRESSGLFGCRYEHLLGMAAVLTEDCTVWWSDQFEIPQERTG